MDGLIGFTGFVGSALDRQHDFSARFNRENIGSFAAGAFETLVCAAAPGSMVEANRNTAADRRAVEALIEALGRARTDRFVLVSTIAALARFDGGADEGTADFQEELAYGRHRRMLEAFCGSAFRHCLVVRLPSLFGQGLKKNFLFDIMNPLPSFLSEARYAALYDALGPSLSPVLASIYRMEDGFRRIDRGRLAQCADRAALEGAALERGVAAIAFHHPRSTYQFYDVTQLWADIARASDAGLGTIHLVPAPLAAGEIHQRLRGASTWHSDAAVHREDVCTRHAALWGRTDGYLADAATTLDALAAFAVARR